MVLQFEYPCFSHLPSHIMQKSGKLNADDSKEEIVVNGCAVSESHIFPSYRLRSCKKGVNSMQGT